MEPFDDRWSGYQLRAKDIVKQRLRLNRKEAPDIKLYVIRVPKIGLITKLTPGFGKLKFMKPLQPDFFPL